MSRDGVCVVDNHGATATGNDLALPSSKRVFLTAGEYPGDLKTAGQAASGLEGGDAICQREAIGAGLGGTWKAWLSGAGQNAIDRIAGNGPWTLVDGELAFPDHEQLAYDPYVPLHIDPYRRDLTGIASHEPEIWTGTSAGGTGSSLDCQGWSDPDAQGTIGVPDPYILGQGVSDTWTQSARPENCFQYCHLYCLEQ